MPPTSPAGRWTPSSNIEEENGRERGEIQHCNTSEVILMPGWHPFRWHIRLIYSLVCDWPLTSMLCDVTGANCMTSSSLALRFPARALAVVCLLLVSLPSTVLARAPSGQEKVLPLGTSDQAQAPAPNKA